MSLFRFTAKLSRYRRHKQISIGTLCAIFIVIVLISYQSGVKKGRFDQQTIFKERAQLMASLAQSQKESIELRQKLIVLERNHLIQLEAEKNLGNHLNVLQNQNTELMRDLMLYQTIAGAPQAGMGLHIQSFQSFRTEDPQTFRYLLVLSKQSSPQQYVQGAVIMSILGKIAQKAIVLPVKYVNSSRNDGLAFKFRHLQELSGELTFPDRFVPEGVQLQVNPDKDWPSLQQEFPWTVDRFEDKA